MSNRFLATMDETGVRSVDSLNRLFRVAYFRVRPSGVTMPDPQRLSDLKREYEEALSALSLRHRFIPERPVSRRGKTKDPLRPSRFVSQREPAALAALRDAAARIGDAAFAAGCDPRRFRPPADFAGSFVGSASALDPEAAIAASRVFLDAGTRNRTEQPEAETQEIMGYERSLYLALAAFSRRRLRSSISGSMECREYLEGIVDTSRGTWQGASARGRFSLVAGFLLDTLGV